MTAAQAPTSPRTSTTNREPQTLALRKLNDANTTPEPIDIAAYHKALLLAPKNAALYNNLGYAYALKQQYEEAARWLEKAVSLDANLGAAHYNLGIVYDHMGRLPAALDATRRAVNSDPAHTPARGHLCELYLVLRQDHEAVECYEAFIKLAPNDATTRSNYGSALRRAHRSVEALTSLEETVQLFPESPEAHNQLGVVFVEAKRYDKAVAAFKRAIQLAPNVDEPRHNLGVAELALGNKTAALEQYLFLKRSNSPLAERLHNLIYKKQLLRVNRE
jgi:tetratricopeptide (TPR) repeat protein